MRDDIARAMGGRHLNEIADLPDLLRTVNLDKLPTALLLNRLAGFCSREGMSLDDLAGLENPRIKQYLLKNAAASMRGVPVVDLQLAVKELRFHGHGHSQDDASMISIGGFLSRCFLGDQDPRLSESSGMRLAQRMRQASAPDHLLQVAKNIQASPSRGS